MQESVQLLLFDDVKESERIVWFYSISVTLTKFSNEFELCKINQSDPQTLIEPF